MSARPPPRPPKHLLETFGPWLRSTPVVDEGAELPSGVSSLAYLGLPRLFSVRVVPSAAARERWGKERFVEFPARCSLCMRAPERFASLLRSRGWLRAPIPILRDCIPQCAEHASLGPSLWFDVTVLGYDVAWNIVGACPRFLASAAELNAAPERLPPWRAFPDYGPDAGGWRQGHGEQWRDATWAPYWAGLDAEARTAYLDRWGAPETWRDALERWPGWGASETAPLRNSASSSKASQPP